MIHPPVPVAVPHPKPPTDPQHCESSLHSRAREQLPVLDLQQRCANKKSVLQHCTKEAASCTSISKHHRQLSPAPTTLALVPCGTSCCQLLLADQTTVTKHTHVCALTRTHTCIRPHTRYHTLRSNQGAPVVVTCPPSTPCDAL